MKRFKLKMPCGTMVVTESPDKENPGAVVMFLDRDGTEYTSCSMQAMDGGQTIQTCVYGGDECDEAIYTHTLAAPG